MGKKVTTVYTCDFCRKELFGDNFIENELDNKEGVICKICLTKVLNYTYKNVSTSVLGIEYL